MIVFSLRGYASLLFPVPSKSWRNCTWEVNHILNWNIWWFLVDVLKSAYPKLDYHRKVIVCVLINKYLHSFLCWIFLSLPTKYSVLFIQLSFYYRNSQAIITWFFFFFKALKPVLNFVYQGFNLKSLTCNPERLYLEQTLAVIQMCYFIFQAFLLRYFQDKTIKSQNTESYGNS